MNGRVLADYTRRQLPEGRLTSWDVVLLGGGQERRETVGGLEVPLFLRSPNERIPIAQQRAEGRLVIRRLLAPRDEAIDLDSDQYAAALQITMNEWIADPGRFPLRKSAPDSPSGPAIRRIRGKANPERGLLLIYPLDPRPWGLENYDRVVIGVGVSFPDTEGPRSVKYTVNNIYWDQEYGEAA